MNKENTSKYWLPALVVVGILTTTLFVWRALTVQELARIEQTKQVDAASTKSAVATNRELSSGLVFAGSGGNLPIIRLMVKKFKQTHPDIKIHVPESTGSSAAIRATAAQAIAVGLISRPLTDKEKKLGLTVVPYARTALVIGAHPKVFDDGITSKELVKIYQGTKSRWQDGQEIVVLTREPGDSTITVLEQKSPGFKQAFAESQKTQHWTTLYTDQEMNQTLARKPHAIGFSDVGAITTERLPIKALKLNGVSPTLENMTSGKYPLVRTLGFVFFKDKLPAKAKAFLDFVQSSEGEKILSANGYLPLE